MHDPGEDESRSEQTPHGRALYCDSIRMAPLPVPIVPGEAWAGDLWDVGVQQAGVRGTTDG